MKYSTVSLTRSRVARLTLCGLACVWAVASSRPDAVVVSKHSSLRGESAWNELERRGDKVSLIAAFDAARYAARPVTGVPAAVTLENQPQGMLATFAPEAIRLRASESSMRLRSIGVGYGDALQPTTHIATRSEGPRVEMDRTSHVTEWWINRAAGLEQGFTLREQPGGRADGAWLRVSLAVDGDLKPQVAADGQSAMFVATDGTTRVNYDHLVSTDATGRVLPTRMRTDGAHLWLETDDTNAVYPVTVDPMFTAPIVGRGKYIKASNTSSADNFGYAVALSGDTAVIGAYQEDGGGTGSNPPSDDNIVDAGAAYVFVRNAGVWSQQAYLKAPNPQFFDYFGWSVGVSGDTVVVGSLLEDGSGTGVDPVHDDNAEDSGAAFVFVRNGTTWSQQAYLKPSNTEAYDFFGWSVAVSGDSVIVGSLLEDGGGTGVNPSVDENGPDSGAAYVFTRSGVTWSQQAYIKASNPGAGDQFGSSIALDGDTALVGALAEDGSGANVDPGDNDDLLDAGAAYVFFRSSGTWSQQAYLKASNPGGEDFFGWSVAISGDDLVVGAGQEDGSGIGVNPGGNENAADAGAAYVFTRNGSSWFPTAYLKASNTGAGDWFGQSVGISGNLIIVGAYLEDGSGIGVNPSSDDALGAAGAAYIFFRFGSTWSSEAYIKSSNSGFVDYFGYAVAVSGDTFLVGANLEDGSGTGINPPSNNSAPDAGAIYILVPPTIPGAPTAVGGTPGNTQVSVSFTPPADDGGIPIISYKAVASPGGAQTTGASSPLVVTGLSNGTPYTFTVTATNEVGTGPASAPSGAITPCSVPGSPTGATATGGNAQASVTFTAPVSDGGCPITGYTVTSNPAGGTDSNAGAIATTHVVTGLTNGTSYTFTVVAINAAGSSAPSSASNSVTPMTVPGAPVAVTASPGNKRATVGFAPPASNGGSAITGYTVTSNPAGGVDTNAGSTSTNHVITGLTNGTAYTFTVVATNVVGAGAASAASTAVTPRVPYVDLDGDDLGDVFLYDAATGDWSWQLGQAGGGFVQQATGHWDPGWLITPARFNGDKLTDFLLFNATSGQWFRMLNSGAGFTVDATGFWWQGWERYVMDLDTDGISDVFLYDPATGTWFKSISTGGGFTYTQGGWNSNWELYPVTLDADSMGDFFLINRTTGRWFWALGQAGPAFTYPVTEIWFTGWQLYPGDFSGDGLTDFLLHDPPTGQYFIATTTGSGFSFVQSAWSLGWKPYVLDLNADAKADLFLHDPSTGVWFHMIGDGAGNFTNAGGNIWSLGWDLYPTDFNGDQRGDLLLYDPATGFWYQAHNLVDGSFSYFNGGWTPGLTLIVRPPIR